MAEIVTFSASVDPAVTVFRISRLSFDWFNQKIDIRLRKWNGSAFEERELSVTYTGSEATALMTLLNKANLSTAGNSLHKRVLDKLADDAKIPSGTVSGSPD